MADTSWKLESCLWMTTSGIVVLISPESWGLTYIVLALSWGRVVSCPFCSLPKPRIYKCLNSPFPSLLLKASRIKDCKTSSEQKVPVALALLGIDHRAV